jgi:two-component system phosphate regulon response regulator PhoB
MPVKILIADDEPNQLELLSYNLVQAGFDVAQAHDGQAAMTMIEDWHPDLVVLDWMMPHMSGNRTLPDIAVTRRYEITANHHSQRPR